MNPRPTAAVYVDGLNLYKLLLVRDRSIRWLNPVELMKNMFRDYEIVKVHYFTTELRRTDSLSAQKLSRQKNYFRALNTQAPLLQTHLGTFRADRRLMPLLPLTLNEEGSDYLRAEVLKVEEKGSDVHLASRLVADAAKANYAFQIVLSNDSDLVPAISIAAIEFSSRIDLVLPLQEIRRGSNNLRKQRLNSVNSISAEMLIANQFPKEMTDDKGRFHRPERWT
jgi:hypothetical protein